MYHFQICKIVLGYGLHSCLCSTPQLQAFEVAGLVTWCQRRASPRKTICHITKLLTRDSDRYSSCEGEKSSNDSIPNANEGLLRALYEDRQGGESEIIVRSFLNEKLIKGSFSAKSILNTHFKELFIIFNNSIPSTAAVERMFLSGKDILKPKRSILSEKHFEILAFLRPNKQIECSCFCFCEAV